jgi:hypothetical protein
MFAHEFGHAVGLGHATPGSGNIMEPVLGSVTTPQAGDTAELLERYPITSTTGDPTPTTPSAPPVGAPVPGPPVSSTLVTATDGALDFNVNVGKPGVYVILVMPLQ